MLASIGADDLPIELVLNKADLLGPEDAAHVEARYPDALLVSAATGVGLDALKAHIAELFADRFDDVRLFVPYADGDVLSALYALGAPIEEREDGPDGVQIRAKLPRREARRFARYLVVDDEVVGGAAA